MTLKLGVPNKGRLNERTMELLTKAGLDLGEDFGRKLYLRACNQDVEVLFLRAQDIPEFVATGAIDVGITGHDMVAESGYELDTALDLRFGYCHMALAVPESCGVKDASQISDGCRIATSYPNIAKKFFDSIGKKVNIIVVTGAAEIMPYLGISDYIVDLVSTGSTLKMNRMIEAGRILDSQAAVFTTPSAKARLGEQIDELVNSIESVIEAENKKYIMADVPRAALPEVERIIPGIGGPTVLEIAGNSGYVAVHAVIDSDKTFHTIAELKKIGAKGILTTPIERLVN